MKPFLAGAAAATLGEAESPIEQQKRVRQRLQAAVDKHFDGDLRTLMTYFDDDFSGELSRPEVRKAECSLAVPALPFPAFLLSTSAVFAPHRRVGSCSARGWVGAPPAPATSD